MPSRSSSTESFVIDGADARLAMGRTSSGVTALGLSLAIEGGRRADGRPSGGVTALGPGPGRADGGGTITLYVLLPGDASDEPGPRPGSVVGFGSPVE